MFMQFWLYNLCLSPVFMYRRLLWLPECLYCMLLFVSVNILYRTGSHVFYICAPLRIHCVHSASRNRSHLHTGMKKSPSDTHLSQQTANKNMYCTGKLEFDLVLLTANGNKWIYSTSTLKKTSLLINVIVHSVGFLSQSTVKTCGLQWWWSLCVSHVIDWVYPTSFPIPAGICSSQHVTHKRKSSYS